MDNTLDHNITLHLIWATSSVSLLRRSLLRRSLSSLVTIKSSLNGRRAPNVLSKAQATIGSTNWTNIHWSNGRIRSPLQQRQPVPDDPLRLWQSNSCHHCALPPLRPLVHQQNQIGWDQLFRGRMCLSSGPILNMPICKIIPVVMWLILAPSGSLTFSAFSETVSLSCGNLGMRLSLDQPLQNLASRQWRKFWLNFVTSTPTELITVPAMFRFSCHLQQLITQFAAKEYLVFKIGSKPGSRILSPLAGSPIISPSSTAVASAPVPNHLPHLLSPPATSRAVSFPLYCRIFSASICLTPPSSTFILPDLQCPVVKASATTVGRISSLLGGGDRGNGI
jgi:hypothetical protein